MSWDEFEQMLVDNGWKPEDAKRERQAQEHGDLGNCDGDWSMTAADHFKSIYMDIVDVFDKDKTAGQFLREDGEGGFRAGVYRMAREIDRLRAKCGEPAERDPNWDAEEDAEIDALIRMVVPPFA